MSDLHKLTLKTWSLLDAESRGRRRGNGVILFLLVFACDSENQNHLKCYANHRETLWLVPWSNLQWCGRKIFGKWEHVKDESCKKEKITKTPAQEAGIWSVLCWVYSPERVTLTYFASGFFTVIWRHCCLQGCDKDGWYGHRMLGSEPAVCPIPRQYWALSPSFWKGKKRPSMSA